jgi:hypothetical protein
MRTAIAATLVLALDEEVANTRLVRRMKETIWKARPGYLFGYNAGTQVTWSVGADNTLKKPVFRIGVDDCVMHPLPGVPAISNPTLEIKATDFK